MRAVVADAPGAIAQVTVSGAIPRAGDSLGPRRAGASSAKLRDEPIRDSLVKQLRTKQRKTDMNQGASRMAAIGTLAVAVGLSGGARDARATQGERDVSEARVCKEGAIECVSRVIREMTRRFDALARRCDHDAIFALVYLRTTEVYRDTAETIGYDDVASVTREDALFADYYFRAFDAYHGRPDDSSQRSVPPAWQIAFDSASARTLSAQGNAFLGVSAHIQRDLPFVLYDLYTQGHAVSYEDHTLVNEFLAQVDVAPEIMARFDPTYPPGSDISLIAAWRETAFRNFERLRDATPVERIVIAAEIEYSAALFAQNIVASTAYPPGSSSSERDAYCHAQRD
jgi:hypothetical protein